MNKNLPSWLVELVNKSGYISQFQFFEDSATRYGLVTQREVIRVRQKFVIVLEGLPGGGKTTITQMLTKKLKCEFVDQIIIQGDQSKEDFFIKNDEEKCRKSQNSKKEICIVDRNFVSTLSYNYAAMKLGEKNEFMMVSNWYEKNFKKKLFIPDVYIFLDVSIKDSFTRKNRIPHNISDIWHSPQGLQIMRNYYRSYFSDEKNYLYLFKINTNNLSKEQVLSRIVEQLRRIDII